MDDILGYDDDDWDVLSGEDTVAIGYNQDEIIGRGRGRSLPARMKRAREVDPHAAAVVPRSLNKRRRKILGSAQVVVTAGAAAQQTFATQELFRPERFVVNTVTAALTITNITVGTSSQLAALGDIPAEVFRPDAVDVDVHFATANVGNDIVVTWRNDTAGDITAQACFIGTSIN